MKIVTVVPIKRGIFKESFSYFTNKEAQTGTLVSVPIRNKKEIALVIAVSDAQKMKGALRKSDFKLKAISSIKANSPFLPEFIDACKTTADYFFSPLGLVIKDFVPSAILKDITDFAPQKQIEKNKKNYETKNIQAPIEERIGYYKSIIREEFAKRKSVFICVPTFFDAKNNLAEISKGIEKYSFLMHAEMSAKEMKTKWKQIITTDHPLLIIATKSFLSIPKQDIGTIIIENENSSFYKSQIRPYTDTRKFIEIFAEKIGAKIVRGDLLLRAETIYEETKKETPRIISPAKQKIIDISLEKNSQIISKELESIIKTSADKNEKTILFINRKGYYPATVCRDCSRIVLCKNCEAPLVMHKENNKKKNLCHKCLQETDILSKCPICNSWRLETLGFGIQKIAEEIKNILPNYKIYRMDSDLIKNEKTGREIAKNFYEEKNNILIGTEILFSYINKQADNVAVISIDQSFNLPNFRTNEKIFRILLRLRNLAKNFFIIQTRLTNQNIFINAINGNRSNFYKEELANRARLGYPPFKKLIKITKEAKENNLLQKEIKAIADKLKKWNPVAYPAFIKKIKGVYVWHILIKIDNNQWLEQKNELNAVLQSLPISWKINVDPESLL